MSKRRASLRDFEELLAEGNEDLDKNKAARKLRELGATYYPSLTHAASCHKMCPYYDLYVHIVDGRRPP
ncbi:hypothetical protein [Cupriavidus necator]